MEGMHASQVLEPEGSFPTSRKTRVLWFSNHRDWLGLLSVDMFCVGCRGQPLSASLCWGRANRSCSQSLPSPDSSSLQSFVCLVLLTFP